MLQHNAKNPPNNTVLRGGYINYREPTTIINNLF